MKISLPELFEPGKDTLFIYNMMFPRDPDEDVPCPSCTQFLDSFDGVVAHAGQRINVAVVVKTELSRALAHAEDRGWRRLRLLSSAGNAYNRDYHAETDDGRQQTADVSTCPPREPPRPTRTGAGTRSAPARLIWCSAAAVRLCASLRLH
jgi:predicted dithiol-disulfide oxidoreductase (DUF899 family)